MNEKIKEIALQVCQDQGFSLYDIELKNTDNGRVLCVRITGVDGVTLDECASVSRKLNYELDIVDLVATKYFLEVSSPGLERPLKNENHYNQAIGETVRVVYRQKEGNTSVSGLLKEVTPKSLILEPSDSKEATTEEIPISSIKKARTVFHMKPKARR